MYKKINLLKEQLVNKMEFVNTVDEFIELVNDMRLKYSNTEYFNSLITLMALTEFQYNVPQCIFPTTQEVVEKLDTVYPSTIYREKDSDDGYYRIHLLHDPMVIEWVEI